MTEKKLPVMLVKGCDHCPFCDEYYQRSYVCVFPVWDKPGPVYRRMRPTNIDVSDAATSGEIHSDCPGRTTHVRVEFVGESVTQGGEEGDTNEEL